MAGHARRRHRDRATAWPTPGDRASDDGGCCRSSAGLSSSRSCCSWWQSPWPRRSCSDCRGSGSRSRVTRSRLRTCPYASATATVPASSRAPGLGLGLGTPASLEVAAGRLGRPLLIPSAVDRPPDAAYVDSVRGTPIVTLVWRAGPDLPALTTSSDVGLLVSQFPATIDEGLLGKILREGVTELERLEVDGHPAFWITGAEHILWFRGRRRRGGRDVRPAGRRHARGSRSTGRSSGSRRAVAAIGRSRSRNCCAEGTGSVRAVYQQHQTRIGDHPWLVGALPGSPAPPCSSAGSSRRSWPGRPRPAVAAMPSWNATPPNSTVRLTGSCYDPMIARVPTGATVRFVNGDDLTHVVVGAAGRGARSRSWIAARASRSASPRTASTRTPATSTPR